MSLVAYWPFDENTGTSIADASGNGHTATMLSGGAWDATATKKFGTSAIKNSGTAAAHASFTAISLGVTHSISFWIDGWDGSNDGMVVAGATNLYGVYLDATNIYIAVNGAAFSVAHGGLTGSHHIVITRSAGSTIRIYKDNVQLGFTTTFVNNIAVWTISRIGGYPDGTVQMVATLDDMRLYDHTLTTGEINSLYTLTPSTQTITGAFIPAPASVVIDTYASSNHDGYVTTSASTFIATSVMGDGRRCGQFWWYLKKTAAGKTGLVRCHLYAATGTHGTNAKGTGAPLATSPSVSVTTIDHVSAQWVGFDFPTAPQLAVGTTYVFAFELIAGSGTEVNHNISTDASSPTSAGNSSTYDTGSLSWSAPQTWEPIFEADPITVFSPTVDQIPRISGATIAAGSTLYAPTVSKTVLGAHRASAAVLNAPSVLSRTVWVNVARSTNGGVASSSSDQAGYEDDGAINGNRTISDWGSSGGWASASSTPQWLVVQFAGMTELYEIDVITYGSASAPTLTTTTNVAAFGLIDYLVEYWNGSVWVTYATVTGNTKVWRQWTITPGTLFTTKIRISVTAGGDGFARIVELEAWGYAQPTVLMPTRASTLTLFAPTVSQASTTVLGATVVSGAALFAPTVQQTVLGATIASLATLNPPTVTPAAVTVLGMTATSTAQVFAPTVAVGDVAVAGATLASSVQLNAPTLAMGLLAPTIPTTAILTPPALALEIATAFLSAGSQVFAPTITPGAVTALGATIASSAVQNPPTITPGAVDVLGDTIASTVQVNAPAVAMALLAPTITTGAVMQPPSVAYEISAPTVAATAVLNAPSVGVEINAPTLASTVVVNPPSLAMGLLTPTISTTAVMNVPSVAYEVHAPTVAATSVVTPPSVASDVVTVLGATVPSGATLTAPTVTTGPVETTGATLTPASQVFAPTVTPGAVTVLGAHLASTTTMNPPVVGGGLLVPTLGSTVALYAPTVAYSVLGDFRASTALVFPPSVAAGLLAPTVPTAAVLHPPTLAYRVTTVAIAPASVVFAPTIIREQPVGPPTVGSTAQLFPPKVALSIETAHLSSELAVFPPTISQPQPVGGLAIAPTSVVFAPSVQPGAVTVIGATIPPTSAVYPPSITTPTVTVTANPLIVRCLYTSAPLRVMTRYTAGVIRCQQVIRADALQVRRILGGTAPHITSLVDASFLELLVYEN